MKISAIICEYNPMHSGHTYHIAETRRITGCDKVICIMSGSFTQRGDIAVYDKFSRTRAALTGGADMVIELPTVFSTASAEKFAYGGAAIAHLTGTVDCLSFGCEDEDINALSSIADLLNDEPLEYKGLLKAALDKGMSFPSARAKAISQIIPNAERVISSPNNILAIEYLKALKRLNSSITPIAIPRKGSGYLDKELSSIPSAMAVREGLSKGEKLASMIPHELAACYSRPALFNESMFIPLMLKLRSMDEEDISLISGVEEGLSYRIKGASKRAGSYEELVSMIKSKRYTETRIKRILSSVLLNIKKDAPTSPEYIRILGVRKDSRELLSMINRRSGLPVVISPAAFPHPELKRDILAADIRALLEIPPAPAAEDLTSPLIVV